MITREAMLHQQVVNYMKFKYPNVLFRTDLGGVRLTMGQAAKIKRMQAGRAWPDLFIAEPRKRQGQHYCGLFVELKAEGTVIFKRDGELRMDKHLREQHDLLQELKKRGYWVNFAVGFEEAKLLIDNYLKD